MKVSNDWKAVGLLGAILTLLFVDVLFLGNSFYFRDLTTFYYPTKQIIRETILAGEFPYWNRFYSAGQPMAANPEYEIFYPPQWLILLPDYHLGFRLHIIVHFFIAAIGMYALLRSLELTTPAAFVGALSFTLSGMLLSLVSLLPYLFAMSWMPLTVLFARRVLIRPNLRDLALASLFLAMQLLIGEPTTVAQTAILLALFAIWMSWGGHPRLRSVLHHLLLVAAIVAAALLIAAVQIVPAIDHVGDSVRSRPFAYEVVTGWSTPPIRALELLFPNLLGPLAENAALYWGAELYPRAESPFLLSLYLGFLAAVLILSGVLQRIRGFSFVLVIAAISYLLALGEHTPVFRWLYAAGVRSIRYPEKFALMGLFVFAIFAAIALDHLARGDKQMRRVTLRVAAALTVVALALATVASGPWYTELFIRFWGVERDQAAAVMARISGTDWLVAVARGAVLLLVLAARSRLSEVRWCVLVTVFVLGDLGTQANRILPRMPRRFFTSPPAAASLDLDRGRYRIFHEGQWQRSAEGWRRYALAAGGDVYWLYRNGLFPLTTASSGIQTVLEPDIDLTNLLPATDLVTVFQVLAASGRGDWAEPLLEMSNVRYRAVLRPFELERQQIKSDVERATPVELIPFPGNDRYYFAEELIEIRDLRDFVDKLTTGPWKKKSAFVPIPVFTPAPGQVRRVAETANRAVLDIECQGQGLLVIAVTPHKYWKARLDGEPVSLLPVNVGYQGVVVPPGNHRLEMRYANRLVPISGVVSLAALGGVVLILLRARK